MKKNKVKLKINKKGVLVILLTLYLIIVCFYYFFTLKIKNITIIGNDQVSDEEIIASSKLDYDVKVINVRKKKVESNIDDISLIKNSYVNVSIFGNIVITIEEQNILFYNAFNKKYVLENKAEVDSVSSDLGIPVLINYVPSDIYKNLIKKMSKIDISIIRLISEIEYSPDIKNDVTIDANRFLLRMNDENYVYINLANFDKLNRYRDFYSTIDDGVKGIFNLDSSSNSGVLFQSFASINKEE